LSFYLSLLCLRPPPLSPLFPYTTLFRSPPFIQSFFNQKIDIIRNGNPDSTYLPLCDGDTYTLVADDIPGATYTWTFNNTPLPERSEEHTSELQSRENLVCRLLLEKKKLQ